MEEAFKPQKPLRRCDENDELSHFFETLWLCIRALWAYDREILNLEKMQHSDHGKMMSN